MESIINYNHVNIDINGSTVIADASFTLNKGEFYLSEKQEAENLRLLNRCMVHTASAQALLPFAIII